MPKLTRSQINQARKQARIAREKAEEALSENEEEAQDNPEKEKKDKMGLTRSQREQISEIKGSLDKDVQKISWRYTPGDLVHLPTGEIGMIVENNAVDLEVKNTSQDVKNTLRDNRYSGQVFVITSSGNNWYYPKQLKFLKK